MARARIKRENSQFLFGLFIYYENHKLDLRGTLVKLKSSRYFVENFPQNDDRVLFTHVRGKTHYNIIETNLGQVAKSHGSINCSPFKVLHTHGTLWPADKPPRLLLKTWTSLSYRLASRECDIKRSRALFGRVSFFFWNRKIVLRGLKGK